MRAYITNFMSEFSYPDNAREVLLSTYDKIVANPEARAIWDNALSAYNENINCDYEGIIAKADKASDILDIHEFTLELLIFICMSKHLYPTDVIKRM